MTLSSIYTCVTQPINCAYEICSHFFGSEANILKPENFSHFTSNMTNKTAEQIDPNWSEKVITIINDLSPKNASDLLEWQTALAVSVVGLTALGLGYAIYKGCSRSKTAPVVKEAAEKPEVQELREESVIEEPKENLVVKEIKEESVVKELDVSLRNTNALSKEINTTVPFVEQHPILIFFDSWSDLISKTKDPTVLGQLYIFLVAHLIDVKQFEYAVNYANEGLLNDDFPQEIDDILCALFGRAGELDKAEKNSELQNNDLASVDEIKEKPQNNGLANAEEIKDEPINNIPVNVEEIKAKAQANTPDKAYSLLKTSKTPTTFSPKVNLDFSIQIYPKHSNEDPKKIVSELTKTLKYENPEMQSKLDLMISSYYMLIGETTNAQDRVNKALKGGELPKEMRRKLKILQGRLAEVSKKK